MTTRDFIIRFKKSTGRLPSQVELSKSLKISPQTALQALIQYTKEGIKKEQTAAGKKSRRDNTVLFLKIVLFALFLMTFTLSVYFTGLWFKGRFNLYISGLISLSMVLFMVIAPQTLRYVNNLFVKTVIVISFMIALTFSMMSTTAGQYNKTSEKQEVTVDNSSLFDHYETRRAEILSLLEGETEKRQVHVQTMETLSADREKNAGMLRTERTYIKLSDERIDSFNNELQEINAKMEVSLESGSVEERKDFFSFISLLTGREKTFIEFVVSSMPAVFIDLIAALCLNLALFIGKEK